MKAPLFKAPSPEFVGAMASGYLAAELARFGPPDHQLMLSIWYGFCGAALWYLPGHLWDWWRDR